MIPEENQLMDFNNYMKRSQIEGVSSIFEKIINEGLTLNYTDKGDNKVNIIAGRFQPFTSGHVKVLEQIHKQNGLPVLYL